MAVAPVPAQDLYDTIYQERYMGRPQQNVDGYKNGSPITFASGLRGDTACSSSVSTGASHPS